MSSLPLSKKLSEDNLFNQLNLPLSSKWPEIKKAYEKQAQVLKTAIDAAKDSSQKAQQEQKLRRLDTAYRAFSERLSQENANVHQTKEALKSVGLNETADWDKVNKRFDELRQSQPEQASALKPQMDVLQKNKAYLEPNPTLGKRTLLTAALVLGAAGISWAAYNHLSTVEKGDMLNAAQRNASPAAEPTDDLSFIDDETLAQYIQENTTFEDELLSLLGMLPSPELSLSLQYKMQVFSSLVKSV
ncbi:hypothetical protein [Sphingobacterium sp. FBM7-1]|uniref:hypothetical protein n=1 Tax=Sphingobacterium sp. FBM7-1 TaxID=2886688 RepID=UPI001D1069CF|nr:hypothetical protein [Sphingobacterium sp. FBM7-1]MCC2599673.1 hypothetical protein [Sphingobacterium sp. FBM7-1]